MAADLLFDLDSIDFSNVTVSAERVGEINAQCGPMRQLDYVIWMNEPHTQILGVKQITDKEFWVPYHIPGRPVMPGVMIIEAAAQVCSILYRYKVDEPRFIGFTRCDEAVFRQQVVPGDTLYLLCEEIEVRRRRFISQAQAVVNGQLAFEATITGMVI